ncbi:bcl-2-like protein 15 [Megalops cyprinoides]|uniref:bcl-2-like protein 15 n=1 Tax=Megalops cyprinoides TaxID=118141 RepID=UPI0018648401|nr:bcl-2-like protein 15 [Megalops cyprinoides]
MAPRDIQEQTALIIRCLFDDSPASFRNMSDIEPDGTGDDDDFDPVIIADQLRKLGDDFEEKFIQPLIKDVQQAAANQVETAFSNSVQSLCKTWVAKGADVAPEMRMLRASISLGLYVKSNYPEMIGVIQNAMTSFINNHVAPWVDQVGGWDNVAE